MKNSLTHRHSTSLLIFLSFWIIWGYGSPVSSAQVWTVHMVGADTLSVESTHLTVDFSKSQAWTIRNIKYKGQEIVGEHGANGTVVNAAPKKELNTTDQWHGTGHGKEDVSHYTVFVDNVPHEFQTGKTFSGAVIVLRKESTMGPLGHTAEITFPASGDFIIEKHSYNVLEDLGERFHFVYAFMHCNNNALDRWLALLGNGKELEGKAGKQDNTFSLQEDIKGIIFYSETLGIGVVYEYPEVYRGSNTFRNSIWDREHDNKLYFRPDIRPENFKIGDRFTFSLKVTPFSAKRTNWMETGRALTRFSEK